MKYRSIDAVVAAPDSHKVILENKKVRILEVIIKPHQKEPMHVHKYPSVMIIRSSARIRFYNADGKSKDFQKRNISPKKPLIEYLLPEGSHAIENIDNETYYAIRIELKK